jgi:hypothetical protein
MCLLLDFFSFMRYGTISYYDITITFLFINCSITSVFDQHKIHGTIYDNPIVASLTDMIYEPQINFITY